MFCRTLAQARQGSNHANDIRISSGPPLPSPMFDLGHYLNRRARVSGVYNSASERGCLPSLLCPFPVATWWFLPLLSLRSGVWKVALHLSAVRVRTAELSPIAAR